MCLPDSIILDPRSWDPAAAAGSVCIVPWVAGKWQSPSTPNQEVFSFVFSVLSFHPKRCWWGLPSHVFWAEHQKLWMEPPLLRPVSGGCTMECGAPLPLLCHLPGPPHKARIAPWKKGGTSLCFLGRSLPGQAALCWPMWRHSTSERPTWRCPWDHTAPEWRSIGWPGSWLSKWRANDSACQSRRCRSTARGWSAGQICCVSAAATAGPRDSAKRIHQKDSSPDSSDQARREHHSAYMLRSQKVYLAP